MHGEYVDGTLNFFVNYDMFVKKKEVEADTAEIINLLAYPKNLCTFAPFFTSKTRT